ncbi:hypothetical protein CDAR_315071 [Caerostris darwini]|uniref:Uncharacterized protein n=1 Tax=Caerostris darwini TaxID=1538125 RepID=A0AAV4TUD6_9ARAC|nr:hypothetical protein CDAR_315071 [Caerostris darwini]
MQPSKQDAHQSHQPERCHKYLRRQSSRNCFSWDAELITFPPTECTPSILSLRKEDLNRVIYNLDAKLAPFSTRLRKSECLAWKFVQENQVDKSLSFKEL